MSKPIGLHPENPRYFLYKAKPLVLITATEHYGAVINRNFDYIAYLDDAAEKRQTLSRCFLLFRELQVFDPATQVKPINPHSPCKPLPVEYVAPWMRSGPGFATDGYPSLIWTGGIRNTSSDCTAFWRPRRSGMSLSS